MIFVPCFRQPQYALAALLLSALPLESQTEAILSHSKVFPFDKLPVDRSANGTESRPVLRGSCQRERCWKCMRPLLPAGAMPHPPHHHLHSELWLVREGTVELTVEGHGQTVGPAGKVLPLPIRSMASKTLATAKRSILWLRSGPGV